MRCIRQLCSLFISGVAVLELAYASEKIGAAVPSGLGPLSKSLHGFQPESDLGRSDRKIWIITTASLPWLTGTSVNPLLRAALMTRGKAHGSVVLMVPYLEEEEDQRKVFPKLDHKLTHEEQITVIRKWLEASGLGKEASRLQVRLYPARYHASYGSIFPMGDLCELIPKEDAQVCVLEEPEHLCWYRAPGPAWTDHFDFVVGIVHTNYLAYAEGYGIWGPILSLMLKFMNKVVVRAHSHRIIKLSATIQALASEKEVVCNVHGVRPCFLREDPPSSGQKVPMNGAYFIGKSLWAKGYDGLLKLGKEAQKRHGFNLALDLYGSGPDREEIEGRFKKSGLSYTFHDAIDHSKLKCAHKVFVNPSVSEVLCTTTAEALAMGKWVVIARHPSNEFFYKFPNCLTFDASDPNDYASCVAYALRHEPTPLNDELRLTLSWDAAIQRLECSSLITESHMASSRPRLDSLSRWIHATSGRGRLGDFVRQLTGAGVASAQVRFVQRNPDWAAKYTKNIC